MTEDRDPNATRISTLLQAAHSGDRVAAEQLLPALYDELRSLARSLMSRLPPGQTLQATSLVHEAYAKLVRGSDPGWDGRGHFFGAAARAMREILVDRARRRSADKRGGAWRRVMLQEGQITLQTPGEDVLALHDALTQLEADDPQKAEIIMLRYFAGLTMTQIAEELKLSRATVDRQWRFARAWLYRQLSADADEATDA